MQLKYRGIAYQASVVEDQAEDSAQVGLSRHKTAQTQISAKDNLRKPGAELIYRGVRYTK
jgi:hypothetical protein